MTDYTELVKALRCELHYTSCPVSDCKYICHDTFCDTYRLMVDAADAIEKITAMYEKAEMDATNLTGRLAQAEADIDRLNLEIDKRIATEIELSKSLDAANHQLKMYSMCPFDDEED